MVAINITAPYDSSSTFRHFQTYKLTQVGLRFFHLPNKNSCNAKEPKVWRTHDPDLLVDITIKKDKYKYHLSFFKIIFPISLPVYRVNSFLISRE